MTLWGLLLILLTLLGCSAQSYTQQARNTLASHTWMLQARPQQGQSSEQTTADWQTCEQSAALAQADHGAQASVWVPFASYSNIRTLYHNFVKCMEEHGYTVVNSSTGRPPK